MTEEAGLALVFSGQHSRVIAVALLNEAAPQQHWVRPEQNDLSPPVLLSSPWRRFWRDLEPLGGVSGGPAGGRVRCRVGCS